jgi:transposase
VEDTEEIILSAEASSCAEQGPQFAEKAADIVGLTSPSRECHLISVDEKPGIQAKTQKTGFVREHDGTVVTGVNSTYRRNGTTNLFAALSIATGSVKGKTTKYKKREDFLAFMDEVVEMEKGSLSEGKELHVILDNYCTHKRCTEWLDKHPDVHFRYTPTSASWLNMVEIWFNIMSRRSCAVPVSIQQRSCAGKYGNS